MRNLAIPFRNLAMTWQKKNLSNLLCDGFDGALVAGAVNGTLAIPGPGGIRTVVDTGSNLSLTGAKLVVAGATGTYRDPSLYYPSTITRVPGRVLTFTLVTPAIAVITWCIGFATNTTGFLNDVAWWQNNSTFQPSGGGNSRPGFVPTVGAPYQFAIVLRATGAFFFHKAPSDASWIFDWPEDLLTGTPLYTTICAKTNAFTADDMIIAPNLWLPSPVASDGFATWGTTNGLGHAEGIAGGLGVGGAGLTWTSVQGTWGAAAGVASCSALDGGTGLGLATVPSGSADGVFTVNLTGVAGKSGMVLRYVDVDNYLYAYYDFTAGKAGIIKRVAGVESDVMAATARTYAAGAPLTVVLDGTVIKVAYNRWWMNSLSYAVPATTPWDVSRPNHGLYTNNIGPTFDNFQVWARK